MTKNKTEESIFDRLRKQEQLVNIQPTFYLHYDPINKNIINFRNYLERMDSNPFMEITEQDLEVPLKEFDITQYKVVLDKDRKRKLEKYVEKLIFNTIDDYIYEIPKIHSDRRITAADRSFDLLIEQNNKDNVFRIKLAKELREKYSAIDSSQQFLYVYVTEANDPNILYKTLKFTFGDLIINEYYTIDFEDFKGNDVNIYALKYFQDYLHVDVR